MGSLDRLARRHGGQQFNVIGIPTDDDGKAAAAFIKQSKITFKNFLDSKVLLENMLGANTIPLWFLAEPLCKVAIQITFDIPCSYRIGAVYKEHEAIGYEFSVGVQVNLNHSFDHMHCDVVAPQIMVK